MEACFAVLRSGIVFRMYTIDITLDEAARDLAGVIRRLRECGGRVVLTGADGPLAEITPVTRSNTASVDELRSATEADLDQDMREWGPRVVISEISGLPVVARRPGQRMVTSEEIYEELRGSGP